MPEMLATTLTDLRINLARFVREIRRGRRVVLHSHGKPIAVMMPIADLAIMKIYAERFTDQADGVPLDETMRRVWAELGI